MVRPGNLHDCIVYTGAALRIEWISTSLAAQERILVFHLPSLLCTLSTILWKCCLCVRPWIRGTPRYIPISLVVAIPNLEVIVLTKWLGVFDVYQILDLFKLTFYPEIWQKFSSTSCIVAAQETKASPMISRSFAKNKNKCVIGGPVRLALQDFHYFRATAPWINELRASMHKTNK